MSTYQTIDVSMLTVLRVVCTNCTYAVEPHVADLEKKGLLSKGK